jgi:hypothetical protein
MLGLKLGGWGKWAKKRTRLPATLGATKPRNRTPSSERVHFADGLADNNNVINININVAAVLSSGASAFFRKTGRFANDFFQFFASRRVERST